MSCKIFRELNRNLFIPFVQNVGRSRRYTRYVCVYHRCISKYTGFDILNDSHTALFISRRCKTIENSLGFRRIRFFRFVTTFLSPLTRQSDIVFAEKKIKTSRNARENCI